MVEFETITEQDMRLPTVDTSFLLNNKKVQKALETAIRAHAGQTRKSGGPYIDHPIDVTKIIASEWKLNKKRHKNLQAAGLLHDTIEDTTLTFEDLVQGFGLDVANIVEGVSELRSEKQEDEITIDDKKKLDFETVRKVIKGSYLDVNVALTKLADRLHNMRTLGSVPKEKQKSKAQETYIFAGLAEALGMWKVKTELEDLAFKYSEPEIYEKVKADIVKDPRRSNEFIEHIKTNLESLITEWKINAKVEVKKAGVYELFKKRKRLAFEGKIQKDSFSEIDDFVSFRIISDKTIDTYHLLHLLHKNIQNIDYANMDFYIGANRKDNGYSAIHVPVQSPLGMYEIALVNKSDEEFNNDGVVSVIRKGLPTDQYKLKIIFTPAGDVLFLPREVNGLDAAYALNPRLGAQADGILIDGAKSTLFANIPNASTIEIVTSKDPRRIPPSSQFFALCLPRTRKLIDEQFSQENRAQFTSKGRQILESELSRYGLLDLTDTDYETTDLIFSFGCQTLEDLYYKVGTSIENQQRIILWLNANLISKENTGFTSIRLAGTKDQEGLLGEIATVIMKYGGNISLGVGRGKPDKTFTLKFVVKGIQEKEDGLREMFNNDPRFESCLIV